MRIAFSVLFLATQLTANAAMAQTAAEREACKADYEKFCTGVEQGGGRIIKCLNDHLSELTPECQKVVKANSPG
ncbi:cysteine rich repeat-containing protein [Mesorhizobium amorphae]|uniref:Cysteine rich repeat-containing protein n=1 Tax=Mesorhizobium amorphae CCNWGS0123 TaxID=1082933 RepID=G6YEC6_9HYPH|nr:cysteine rich repeat-containing protein [Mesorhizobium amorphae]ANT50135.1 hypothetical protein A6B35_09435 [Mesorhizobium amorphae CCNWGS0123]EHH09895.1 hypothetical protein MEA186_21596 [Mesorhizobium amorphae CCNWGS0123]GLR39678.1 hypothetical protein GCM10007880_01940 [Mesorhizobium amorphae]